MGNRRGDAGAEEPASKPGPWSTLSNVSKALLGFVALLAGTIAAVAAALYIVVPGLEPRERLGAEIDRVGVAQGVAYGSYVGVLQPEPGVPFGPASDAQDRSDGERDPRGCAAPGTPGTEVLVHANLSGYGDRSYDIRVSAIEAQTFTPVDLPESNCVATCEQKSPEVNDQAVTWRCWMLAPPPGVQYFVRAELFDRGPTERIVRGQPLVYGQLLDFMDSVTLTAVDVGAEGG